MIATRTAKKNDTLANPTFENEKINKSHLTFVPHNKMIDRK